MKILTSISLLFSFSALADFSQAHMGLCQTSAVKEMMGKSGSCHLALASIETEQVSANCVGKLSDISCRVRMLKTSDSASMTLSCGDESSPLLSQVLEAEVLSYNVAAIVKTSAGDFFTINDSNEYHLFSNIALDVLLASGEKVNAEMVLALQDRAITLTDVVCE